MRCPNCNKFPAFDIQEPEEDLQVEAGHVTGTVRLVLDTQCCGDEAKETTFDVDVDLSSDIKDAFVAAGVESPDLDDLSSDVFSFDVEADGKEGDERMENKTRTGKPITNYRYMKKFYVARMEISVTGTYTPEKGEPVVVTVTNNWEDECQASGMEELC